MRGINYGNLIYFTGYSGKRKTGRESPYQPTTQYHTNKKKLFFCQKSFSTCPLDQWIGFMKYITSEKMTQFRSSVDWGIWLRLGLDYNLNPLLWACRPYLCLVSPTSSPVLEMTVLSHLPVTVRSPLQFTSHTCHHLTSY